MIRAAAFVDRESAQVSVKTDPIPQMLDGIPLRIRSIIARIDRSNFALNPTNCSPQSVVATAAGASGAGATVAGPFQVGSCDRLAFNPKLALSLKGGIKRRGHPALKAVLTPRPGDANLSRVSAALPSSELLDNSHIKTICTRVQFAADQCPAESIYGFARATTPLVGAPLEGPVYLRSSSNKLPDLVADLRGQIDVAVAGRIDSTKGGGIRTTFESIPDTPVSNFVLELQGGSKGLLENSKNLCAKTYKATALFNAQNGLTSKQKPALTGACGKHSHGAKKRKHRAGKHGRSRREAPPDHPRRARRGGSGRHGRPGRRRASDPDPRRDHARIRQRPGEGDDRSRRQRNGLELPVLDRSGDRRLDRRSRLARTVRRRRFGDPDGRRKPPRSAGLLLPHIRGRPQTGDQLQASAQGDQRGRGILLGSR